MNDLVLSNDQLKMSSIDIAKLTGKNHSHVLRDIRTMLNEIDNPNLDSKEYQQFTLPNGMTSSIELGKELTYTLISGYNVKLRHAIINRWQQLEAVNQPQFQIPETLPDALRLAAQLAEEKQQAIETIKEKDKLIVAVADLNIRAGDVSVSEFSKNLAIKGLGQNNLYKWLKGRGFLQQNNQPYQQYVARGYFVMKPYEEKIKGEVRYKTMITPRGTAWLSKMLHAEFELEMA